jgi:phenol 2-monooxygenase
MHLGHVIKADGRWRLFAFADSGMPTMPESRIARLCRFLTEDPASPISRHTQDGRDIDSVIDFRVVLQQGFRDLEVGSLPSILLPPKGLYGLRDYEKVFCADRRDGADIFDLRGLDRAAGCMMVVRPDQYVAHVLPLDGYEELAGFFAGVLLD